MTEELNKVEGTENGATGTENGAKATTITEQEGKGKKALKWLVRGLVVLATGAVGFLLGRTSTKDGDEAETDANNEPPTE